MVCPHAVGRGSKWTCKPLGEGAVKSCSSALLLSAALFVHQPFFSRLRLWLFTSRSSRGCGFFCSPAVLLAAAALFVHQPFFSRLRPFLFTSRSSRGCGLFCFTSRSSRGRGFFCSPAVLLAAAAFSVHQPFFWRLRLCLFTSRSSRGCGFFSHQLFFSRLRLFLFTCRSSRGCGFFCSPAVVLAAAALFVHQPFLSRLRLFCSSFIVFFVIQCVFSHFFDFVF